MSATLTWALSALQPKTGATVGDLFADMLAAFQANADDDAFSWEVASSNVASSPYQITLKPKAGGAGRILLVSYAAAPAVNPALFASAPTAGRTWVAFFPGGNVDTPSNLTSATGAVMGDDTDATLCAYLGNATAIYAANFQFCYADCAEGVMLFFQNPATTAVTAGGAGYLVSEIADDTVLPSAIGASTTTSAGNFNALASGVLFPFTPAAVAVGGSGAASVRVVRAGVAQSVYQAFAPTGWASQPISSGDVLSDTASSRYWFAPIILMTNDKGGGFPLKLRQIALGPQSVGEFPVYYESGPTPVALSFCGSTASAPWLLNRKI